MARLEVILEYNGLRLSVISHFESSASCSDGKFKTNATFYLRVPNTERDFAKRKLSEMQRLARLSDGTYYRADSLCFVKELPYLSPKETRIEWGVWLVEATELEIAREEFRQIAATPLTISSERI